MKISDLKCTIIHCIFFILFTFCINAQSGSLSITSDQTTVGAGQQFVLTVTIQNVSIQNFALPDISPFKVVGTGGRSSSTTIVNGAMTTSTSLQFIIQSPQVGQYTIGPFRVKNGGHSFISNSLQIKVVKNNASITQSDSNDNILLRIEASTLTGYVGQQISLQYVLYTKVNIVNYSIDTDLQFSGFYAKPIDRYNEQKGIVRLNGSEYVKQIVNVVSLFPQKTGVYDLGSVRGNFIVQDGGSSRSFFFQDGKKVQFVSNPVQLKIVDLPKPIPTKFSGLVGNFNIKSQIFPSIIKSGTTSTIRTQVDGNGDAKLIQAPSIKVPAQCEIYESKEINSKEYVIDNQLHSSKTFDIPLVTNMPDTNFTAYVELVYFDPVASRYKTIIDSIPIKIVGSGSETIVPEKYHGNLIENPSNNFSFHPFLHKPLFLFSSLSITLLALIILLLIKRSKIYKNNSIESLTQSDEYIAKLHLTKADQYLKDQNYKAFYEEIARATTGFIVKKWNIKNENLHVEFIISILQQHNVDSQIIDLYSKIQLNCEQARFAGIVANPVEIHANALQFFKYIATI